MCADSNPRLARNRYSSSRMVERWTLLREYRFQIPAFDAAFVASGMRALTLLLIVVGAAWAMAELRRRVFRGGRGAELTPPVEME